MLAHQELELGAEFSVATEREVELDPLFQRGQSELFEPPPFELDDRVELHVSQCNAAPERERLSQQLGGSADLAVRVRLRPFSSEALEAMRIHPIGIDSQDVAGRA